MDRVVITAMMYGGGRAILAAEVIGSQHQREWLASALTCRLHGFHHNEAPTCRL